jgi:hypothetical protein
VALITDLFKYDNGVEQFINQRDGVKFLALGLSSPIATLATKGEILTLLSIICTNSQQVYN